jgi:antitoxin (DNA-binding transcriptional repressor) of toxin-antitoxin stability system
MVVECAAGKAAAGDAPPMTRRIAGEAVTVYDRDTPVARLVPYEGGVQASLPVRKATAALRDVELPEPLERDVGSLEALAEERQAGR